LIQLATPHLIKTQGNIVNVTSVLASLPAPVGPFYTTSKAALGRIIGDKSIQILIKFWDL
jgi:NAD(P)-dependent dehydrogenase (short-subunit alcohol dehydrogenase family)